MEELFLQQQNVRKNLFLASQYQSIIFTKTNRALTFDKLYY